MIKLPLTVKRLLGYFPTKLPVGMSHYNAWVAEVAELIGPISTQDELEFCVSAEVMRLGPNTCSVSKNFLANRVRAGAAKQIAGAKFAEIKEKQQERLKQQAAEDTAAKQLEANTSNGVKTAATN